MAIVWLTILIAIPLFFIGIISLLIQRKKSNPESTKLTRDIFKINGYTETWPTQYFNPVELISPNGQVRVVVYVWSRGLSKIPESDTEPLLCEIEERFTVQIMKDEKIPFVTVGIDTLEHLDILFKTYGIKPLKR